MSLLIFQTSEYCRSEVQVKLGEQSVESLLNECQGSMNCAFSPQENTRNINLSGHFMFGMLILDTLKGSVTFYQGSDISGIDIFDI